VRVPGVREQGVPGGQVAHDAVDSHVELAWQHDHAYLVGL